MYRHPEMPTLLMVSLNGTEYTPQCWYHPSKVLMVSLHSTKHPWQYWIASFHSSVNILHCTDVIPVKVLMVSMPSNEHPTTVLDCILPLYWIYSTVLNILNSTRLYPCTVLKILYIARWYSSTVLLRFYPRRLYYFKEEFTRPKGIIRPLAFKAYD